MDLDSNSYVAALLIHAEVSILLFVFIALFLLDFVRKAVIRIRSIRRVNRSIQKTQANTDSIPVFRTAFSKDTTLSDCWKEFERTLHPAEHGQFRSTASAEVYFGQAAVIDQYINVDFYKHLPGILTGIGIIGTFLGLMDGLNLFLGQQKVLDANLSSEVTGLLTHVRYAFMVSATAIAASIVVTVIEKKLVSKLNLLHDKLLRRIDQAFEGGVGELYLSRLIEQSQNSNQALHGLLDLFSKQSFNKPVLDSLAQLNQSIAQPNPESDRLAAQAEKMTRLFDVKLDQQQQNIQLFDQLSSGFYMSLNDLVGRFETHSQTESEKTQQTIQIGTRDLLQASQALKAVVGEVGDLISNTRSISIGMAKFSSQSEALYQQVGHLLEGQTATQAATSEMIFQLQQVTSDIALENSSKGEVIKSLEQSCLQLKEAIRSTEEYLNGVGLILAESQRSFNTMLTESLQISNQEFQAQLGKATCLVAEAVEKLSAQLAAASDSNKP